MSMFFFEKAARFAFKDANILMKALIFAEMMAARLSKKM